MKRLSRIFPRSTGDRVLVAGIALAILVDLALSAHLFAPNVPRAVAGVFSQYPEVRELEGNTKSFKELSDYFTALAEKKGAVYAFDVLKRSHIPPNTDIHLLGHAVGDVLYDQQGTAGMALCTDDFRNACSHQIVINTLVEKGPGSFPEIVDACKQAPGGKNGYSMCFHGLGHGVLAYNGYDLGKAMDMCGLSGKKGGDEEIQCMGGAVMEMMAGVHDPEIWKEQSKHYFDKYDPLSPCDLAVIPARAKGICYIYLTPHLFESAGQKPGTIPSPAIMTKAMGYCSTLEGSSRFSCYGGFGKEYAPMANSKDIRTIGGMTDHQMDTALHWCTLGKAEDGIQDCIVEAARSLYWAGDVDPSIAARFCVFADSWGYGSRCMESFLGTVAAYKSDPSYRKNICDDLPEKFQSMCRSKLL
jgi:hypothetical protein